jgi:nitroimidazol reductase NimA-like FMN-containing flavoprotein (pyridoxamine 5'-phosphate oxidase superfamily)
MATSSQAPRDILAANRFMTLATADEDGTPWASPVWFATEDGRELVWVSKPEARHSRNVEARPEVGIVIFDSQQAPGTGAALYVEARAERVPEDEIDRALAVFNRVSEAQALPAWPREKVVEPARHRLYRAAAVEHSVLDAGDQRQRVDL